MARDIYKNRLNELRELKQARIKDSMVDTILQMSKQVNQRLYRLEKANKIGDTAYRYAQKETGKDKPRYTVNRGKLENMDISELYRLGVQLNNKIVSKTSTLTGLKEIEEKRIEMSRERASELFGVDFDKDQYTKFLEMRGREYLNSKYISSEQVLDDYNEFVQSGSMTLKQFIKEYDKFINSTEFDYGKLRRNLLRTRKKE